MWLNSKKPLNLVGDWGGKAKRWNNKKISKLVKKLKKKFLTQWVI